MRFIREMIARKAAGDERTDDEDFGIEGMDRLRALPDPNEADNKEVAGFEDELEESDLIVDEVEEIHANEDAPASEDFADDVAAEAEYDEEAELDALDAAFPDIEAEEDAAEDLAAAAEPAEEEETAQTEDAAVADNVDQLFPKEEAETAEETFADIPEPTTEEPLPELTAADIERAMANRKKIWHALPDDEDPLAISEEVSDAVTRPIRRISDQIKARPVSVPLDLAGNEAEENAAEVAAPVPTAAAAFEDEIGEDVQDLAPVVDAVEESDEMLWPNNQDAAASDVAEEAEMPAEAEAQEEPAPAPEVDLSQIMAQSHVAEAVEEPAAEAPAAAATDIQAEMARAALEAAGLPAPGAPGDDAKPKRRAGRVKTRLLGFQADAPAKDIFDTAGNKATEPDMFPVGWMVVIEGPGRGASFPLHNGVSLIGRGEDQAITLDFGDNSISRDNHASIAYDDEGNQFYLGHGGKSNIVRLNKKPVLSTEELTSGDTIKLGETVLRFTAFCSGDFAWNDNAEGGQGNAANG